MRTSALGEAPVVRRALVVGDAEEPRRERHVAPAKAADGAEHLQEDLLRRVLGLGDVAEAREGIAIDARHVPVVQVGKGRLVARPGAIDGLPFDLG